MSTTVGPCPHCGGDAQQSQRYPHALCNACAGRATDIAGRPVSMFNESLSGGFLAVHRDDGSPCEQVVTSGRVLVDGLEFRAQEDYWGGIVVQPLLP